MPVPASTLYDPNRGFRTWEIDQVYQGPGSLPDGNVIVNVDDMVVNWDYGLYQVIEVDPVTYIPTLELFNPMKFVQIEESTSIITGLSGYQPNITNRAFYNSLQNPPTITIDSRFRIFGTEAYTLKLFRGTDTGAATGQVISQKLDMGGALIGENIDLEEIDVGNPAIKRPTIIHTNESLVEGEIVTAVIYTQASEVFGEVSFIIKSGDAIRAAGASTVYVQDIVLESPLLDTIETDLIEVPFNTPVTANSFQARLVYSDGSTALVNVDGNKTKIYGLDNFNVSIVGSSTNIVLSYYPDANEPTINAQGAPGNIHISRTYRMQVTESIPDNTYKLFVVPKFTLTPSPIYTLEWWVVDLNRTVVQKLMPGQVTVALQGGGAPVLTPGAGQQTIVATFNPFNVLGAGHANYNDSQAVKLTLNNPTTNTTSFIIDYKGDGVNPYGQNANWRFSQELNPPGDMRDFIPNNSDEADLAAWKDRFVERLYPSYDPQTEAGYPTVDAFRFITTNFGAGTYYDVPGSWNAQLDSPNENVAWLPDETIAVIYYNEVSPSVFVPIAVGAVTLRDWIDP